MSQADRFSFPIPYMYISFDAAALLLTHLYNVNEGELIRGEKIIFSLQHCIHEVLIILNVLQ